MQYVTCTPVAKSDVVNLQENLERKLQTEQARETGNCLERGILLTRIKKELNMTVNSYQSLYESSIAYGIRTLLLAEEEKKKLNDEIISIEKDCENLEVQINEIDEKLRQHKEIDDAERKQKKAEHQQIIEENRAKGKLIKEKLRDKLTFIGK